jgi:hypothetical protein
MNQPQLLDIYSRQDVADRYIRWLREGIPEIGWKGEPRLVLAFNNGPTQRWEVLMHEPQRGQPDRHVVVMTGPPGMEINDQAILLLCQRLRTVDTTIAGNSALEQFDRMMEANERHDAARTEAAAGATSEALGKFYHEAGKTLGVTKTFFPT